jgi:hypothetical protein
MMTKYLVKYFVTSRDIAILFAITVSFAFDFAFAFAFASFVFVCIHLYLLSDKAKMIEESE